MGDYVINHLSRNWERWAKVVGLFVAAVLAYTRLATHADVRVIVDDRATSAAEVRTLIDEWATSPDDVRGLIAGVDNPYVMDRAAIWRSIDATEKATSKIEDSLSQIQRDLAALTARSQVSGRCGR